MIMIIKWFVLQDGGASLRSGSLSENSLTSSICSHEADLEDESWEPVDFVSLSLGNSNTQDR